MELAFAELEALTDFDIYKTAKLSEYAAIPIVEELAKQGVTPEEARPRLRRIERLIGRRRRGAAWPLTPLLEQIASAMGTLGPRAELERLLEAADPDGVVLGRAAHRRSLVLRLAGKYRVRGDWVEGPTLARPQPGVLEDLIRIGPASIAEVRRALDSLGVRPEYQLPWVAGQEDFLLQGDLLFPYGSESDRAAVVLHEHGAPLGVAELHARTPRREKSPRRFESSLGDGRSRLVLFGRDLWGLAEWGGEWLRWPFGLSLSDAIALEIERHGGEMEFGLLVAILGERFGATEEEVRLALRHGVVTDETGEKVSWHPHPMFPSSSKQQLAYEAGGFRRDLGWSLRLVVTARMLAGASVAVPDGFLNLVSHWGQGTGTVECRPGPLDLDWRPRGAWGEPRRLGGLRAAAAICGARRGDRLFLTARPLGGVQLDVVRRERCEAADGLERLALECGREPGADPLVEVARALGIAPDLPLLGERVAERLAQRGERDLLALLGDTATREVVRTQGDDDVRRDTRVAQDVESGGCAGAGGGASIPVAWEGLARATAHPLRVSILEVLGIDGGRTLSPSDLSYELQVDLAKISHHTRALAAAGLIELARERQVRGTTEHFYRLFVGES